MWLIKTHSIDCGFRHEKSEGDEDKCSYPNLFQDCSKDNCPMKVKELKMGYIMKKEYSSILRGINPQIERWNCIPYIREDYL